MIDLRVILSLEDGELGKYLPPHQEEVRMGVFKLIACLPRGMQSGLPTFVALIELPNGEHVLAETSWRNMSLGVVALTAKWGTP